MNKRTDSWTIKMLPEAEATIQGGTLSAHDIVVIREWERTVRELGPDALKLKPSVWADHELNRGHWAGCRASSFSHAGRIIYYVSIEFSQTVLVIRITSDHNYKE